MPIKVSGSAYYRNDEVARLIGVSRQSLWRWRHEGKIPLGRRYRSREVVYTAEELNAIRGYAHRIEPLSQNTNHNIAKGRSKVRANGHV